MMTFLVQSENDGLAARFRNLFKPREIFFHDGKSLRRFSVGARLQAATLAFAFLLLAWSAFATVSIATAADAVEGDVTAMERQVQEMRRNVAQIRAEAQQHAAVLEQRQRFLAALIEGEEDPARLAAMLPQRAESAAGDAYSEVEGMQQNLVARAHENARERTIETAQQIRRLGINPARFMGRGGPLEEAGTAPSGADPRFRQLFVAWRQLDQLEAGIIAIPSGRPINSSVNFTSGYGTRSDPFRGTRAMHAGIDLAGPIGTPIYATADGIVGRSEYSGAYGNLVEINHGQGIQTRFGHMSRLIARSGQRVRRGELIGLMGSTGRSTGSHLHYEVRIDGRAVNPIPFIQNAGTAPQRVASAPAATTVALGGPAAPSGQ